MQNVEELIDNNLKVYNTTGNYMLTGCITGMIEEDFDKLSPDTYIPNMNMTKSELEDCYYKDLKSGERVYVRITCNTIKPFIISRGRDVPTNYTKLIQDIGQAFNAAYELVDIDTISEQVTSLNDLYCILQQLHREVRVMTLIDKKEGGKICHEALLDMCSDKVYDLKLKKYGVALNEFYRSVQKDYWINADFT